MERKHVLITGSSRGIGRMCALAFAEHGWHVFINCRNSLDQLKETERMILASGGICTMLPAMWEAPMMCAQCLIRFLHCAAGWKYLSTTPDELISDC